MFFEDEKIDWTQFNEHELEQAEDAFELLEDEITSDCKPKPFFITGILLTNFVGYEDASEELKDAIAEEIVFQWLKKHPEETSGTVSMTSTDTVDA